MREKKIPREGAKGGRSGKGKRGGGEEKTGKSRNVDHKKFFWESSCDL